MIIHSWVSRRRKKIQWTRTNKFPVDAFDDFNNLFDDGIDKGSIIAEIIAF